MRDLLYSSTTAIMANMDTLALFPKLARFSAIFFKSFRLTTLPSAFFSVSCSTSPEQLLSIAKTRSEFIIFQFFLSHFFLSFEPIEKFGIMTNIFPFRKFSLSKVKIGHFSWKWWIIRFLAWDCVFEKFCVCLISTRDERWLINVDIKLYSDTPRRNKTPPLLVPE